MYTHTIKFGILSGILSFNGEDFPSTVNIRTDQTFDCAFRDCTRIPLFRQSLEPIRTLQNKNGPQDSSTIEETDCLVVDFVVVDFVVYRLAYGRQKM
jgi:hypothetical protein